MKTKSVSGIPAVPDLSPELSQQLERFAPLSLKEAQQKSLMDRLDTKFLLDMRTLRAMLPQLQDDYRALTINGEKALGYFNFYYDTPRFMAYYAHHNNVYDRYKIRNRLYQSTDDNFLEIKRKNNKGRVIKKRVPVDDMPHTIPEEQEAFLRTLLPERYKDLELTLRVSYRRLSLVNNQSEERLTIDFDLAFGDPAGNYTILERTVITELKQPARAMDSAFKRVARAHRLRASSFSKYAIGCALVHPRLRHNNFKPILLKVAKIERDGHHDRISEHSS